MSGHRLESFKSDICYLQTCGRVNSSNSSKVVSVLNSATDAVIWGEHDADITNFFLSSNLTDLFSSLLAQDPDRSVVIQLLKSSSTLIHNLRNLESQAYLLKSEFFKTVLSHPLDFADPEIVENYIYLLKGLSENLTNTQLKEYVIDSNFGLFTGALIFYNHQGEQVRSSSRRVVLKVLNGNKHLVNNEVINKFILSCGFFYNLVNYLKESIIKISRNIASSKNSAKVEQVISECLDLLYEFNDIFDIKNTEFNNFVQEALMKLLVLPILAASIIEGEPKAHHLPMPIAVYSFGLIVKVIEYPPLREDILNVLFSTKIPQSYFEAMMNPLNRSQRLLKSIELTQNMVQVFISRFLKCREDNLIGLSLFLVQSVFYKSLSEFFNCSDLSQSEVLANLLKSFQLILTSEAETRFFTLILASKLLIDIYFSALFPDKLDEILDIFISAEKQKSQSVLTYIKSSPNAIEYIDKFNKELDFISFQSWDDFLNLPLNYIFPHAETSEVPLEIRRNLTEDEYIRSEIRSLLLFKKIKKLLKSQESELTLPFSKSESSEYQIGEFYDVDSEVVKGKAITKVIERGITGYVRYIIEDKQYLALASLHEDLDSYLVESCIRFSHVSIEDKPEPNVIMIVTDKKENIILAFEETDKWIQLKNRFEKWIKESKESDLALLTGFIEDI